VRFTASDDIWLSHGYGRDNAYIAIHQFGGMPYEQYFREFEAVGSALGGRPHWGKMHYRTAETLRPVYPRFDDFLAVRDKVDPNRVFANDYTRQILGD
jgi:L-gulonolactone oxidase